MRNDIRIARLKHLVQVLDKHKKAVDKKKSVKLNGKTVLFDMYNWYTAVDKMYAKKGGCNTAACAGGNAALDPVFRKQGLHIKIKQELLDIPTYILDKIDLKKGTDPDSNVAWSGIVWYKKESGFEALQKFFGLTEDETTFIFDAESFNRVFTRKPIHPRRVICRIKIVMNGYMP